jgi:hypothetical protein
MRILKKERGDCGGGKTIRYYLKKKTIWYRKKLMEDLGVNKVATGEHVLLSKECEVYSNKRGHNFLTNTYGSGVQSKYSFRNPYI